MPIRAVGAFVGSVGVGVVAAGASVGACVASFLVEL